MDSCMAMDNLPIKLKTQPMKANLSKEKKKATER